MKEEATRQQGTEATSLRMRQMTIRAALKLPGASRAAHYSDEWYTPPSIPAALGAFDLAPCAGPMNHARKNIRRPDCGLAAKWEGRVWLNPPYSNVGDWLERLVDHGDGVALVNCRPETVWFQKLMAHAHSVLWLKGRVDFARPDGKATHPPVGSVLVAVGEKNTLAFHLSHLPGVVMTIAHTPP